MRDSQTDLNTICRKFIFRTRDRVSHSQKHPPPRQLQTIYTLLDSEILMSRISFLLTRLYAYMAKHYNQDLRHQTLCCLQFDLFHKYMHYSA